jgi:hypothetical protein
MGLTLWRATGQLPVVRLLLAAGTAIGVLAGGGIPPVLTLAIAFGGVAVLAALEHRSHVRGAPLDL